MTHSDPLATVHPNAVTISVPNLEDAIAWYSQKLGFKEVKRKRYPEFKTALAFLELNHFRVELIEDGNAQPYISRPDPPTHTAFYGISQFSFRTADLAAVREALIQRGIPIVWEFENDELGLKFLFIRDLNNNLIQYLQPLAN